MVSPASEDLPELSAQERARYARHLILHEIGLRGQQKLKASSVACVGAGGLGSPVLLYLAAAGVGRIGLFDFDVVEESNLQRQILFGASDEGRLKVDAARARLEDLNPLIQVDSFPVRLTSENALEALAPYDVVVDGTDNFPTRYLVNDACVLLGKPYIYGSIYKFEGQVSVFNYRGGPNYRDLYPQPPPPGLVPSCAEGGVLGVLPGVIGCIQANETLKVLLGLGDTLSGRLLLYDALQMSFRELKCGVDPARPPIEKLIDYAEFCAGPGSSRQPSVSFASLSAQEVSDRLREGWAPFVLDVRTPQEAQIVSFPFVDHLVPHTEVATALDALPRDRDILVHCKKGVRSRSACEVLAAAGVDRLFNLEGGITAWAQTVDPAMPTY
jgi:adenylyltransferase/sulfurtransferase